MADQKSPQRMIVDRLIAADINVDRLAVEAMGEKVRVTGVVATEAERARALAALGDAQAAGIPVTYAIEVRPSERPTDDEDPDGDIGNPPEPA
jgi:phytoene/squalene synthetase